MEDVTITKNFGSVLLNITSKEKAKEITNSLIDSNIEFQYMPNPGIMSIFECTIWISESEWNKIENAVLCFTSHIWNFILDKAIESH